MESPLPESTPPPAAAPQPSLFNEPVPEPASEPIAETPPANEPEPQSEHSAAEETEAEAEERIVHNLDDAFEDETSETVAETPTNTVAEPEITTTPNPEAAAQAEQKQKAREAFLERQSQAKRTLNDVKMKLRLPGRISDLENEPAYKRRNITLDQISHSSESSVSHFSINEEVDENGERKIELRDDNPFLHDNVDECQVFINKS